MLWWKDSLSRYNLPRHHGNNCKKINNGKSFLSHSILGGVGMSQGNRLSLSLLPGVATVSSWKTVSGTVFLASVHACLIGRGSCRGRSHGCSSWWYGVRSCGGGAWCCGGGSS